ncbi:hypothetical protein NHH03_09060 [Stieleria sp. TO1_6]|uniref:hypothetical protein n=1 Tax=Stieleria tagensis TaxID=2956795 RepID=UPI00209AC716|nr:hypothetical protein [Stieleria tagensis]MCO8121883.1 hypothetical protein [Stieleria tagensis]
MTSAPSDHADKYNDPRVRISRRGILIGCFVLLFGIAGAALSIWARRTQLEKSTQFWGADTILALQLAEEMELIPNTPPAESTENASAAGQPQPPVRLSGMPGLGHLRHVLLDDRSYHWDTQRDQPIAATADPSQIMVLRLTDPTMQRFPETRIAIALDSGWVGPENGSRQVQLNERFRVAMPTFLKRIANYEPLRSEMRDDD